MRKWTVTKRLHYSSSLAAFGTYLMKILRFSSSLDLNPPPPQKKILKKWKKCKTERLLPWTIASLPSNQVENSIEHVAYAEFVEELTYKMILSTEFLFQPRI